MPKESITSNSDFIRDILAYLESMFAALQLLPVCMTSILLHSYIAQMLHAVELVTASLNSKEYSEHLSGTTSSHHVYIHILYPLVDHYHSSLISLSCECQAQSYYY